MAMALSEVRKLRAHVLRCVLKGERMLYSRFSQISAISPELRPLFTGVPLVNGYVDDDTSRGNHQLEFLLNHPPSVVHKAMEDGVEFIKGPRNTHGEGYFFHPDGRTGEDYIQWLQ